jgi:hypothetical protein
VSICAPTSVGFSVFSLRIPGAFLISLLGCLAACAPVSKLPDLDSASLRTEELRQQRMVIEQTLADTAQVHRIVYPILMASADLCGARVALGTGLAIENLYDHAVEARDAAVAAGLGPGLSVIAVAPGSAGARAGLQAGDKITSVGGLELPQGAHAREALFEAAALTEGRELHLSYRRGTEEGDVSLLRDRICDIPYRVVFNEQINAYADMGGLTAYTGLLRFLKDDKAVAVVLGHEIAHVVMGHIRPGPSNATVAGLFDSLFGRFGFTGAGAKDGTLRAPIGQAYEAEADYVGLYLIARAGFPIAEAADVYRHFAVSAPGGIEANDGSHPSTVRRALALDATAKEIAAKQAAGAPLRPEVK